jgi:hypothetical protein
MLDLSMAVAALGTMVVDGILSDHCNVMMFSQIP